MQQGLYRILARNPHLVDFLPFLDNFKSESPRGRVLIAAASPEGSSLILKLATLELDEAEIATVR